MAQKEICPATCAPLRNSLGAATRLREYSRQTTSKGGAGIFVLEGRLLLTEHVCPTLPRLCEVAEKCKNVGTIPMVRNFGKEVFLIIGTERMASLYMFKC